MKRMAYLPLALLFLLLLPGLSPAQDVQSYIDQGIQHSQAGRYDQALQAFDQALKLKPNDPALITYKGIVYYAQGQNDRAMKEFEAGHQTEPQLRPGLLPAGHDLRRTRRSTHQALADLKKAKSLGYGIDSDFIALMERKASEKK